MAAPNLRRQWEASHLLTNAARLRETVDSLVLNFPGSEMWKMHAYVRKSSKSQYLALAA